MSLNYTVGPQIEPLAATISEACRLSGLGRSSIYVLLNTGRLKSVRFGKRRLVVLASLRELIATGASLDASEGAA